jgi:serine/threonine-protein kinase
MHVSTVFLVAFFTSALTAAGTVYVLERADAFGARRVAVDQTEVPELKGLPENDARENLRAQRLALVIKARTPSPQAKPGTVVEQSLPPGHRLAAGSPVAVVIADELPKVPSVAGLVVAEATAKLAERGFKLKLGPPLPDANVAEGKVAAQDPAADTPLATNVPVIVQLSTGPSEIEMPKVVGQPLATVKTDLERAGLKVAPVRWVSLAETATFVVLSQKPEAGQKVKPGTEVQLTANH